MAKKVVARYVYAYDPKIERRCVHVIKGKWAVSLMTGHRFKLPKERETSG